MEAELLKRLDEQTARIEEIATSVRQMKRYFLWTFWLTIAFFVLPLVALVFVLPAFLSSYLGAFSGLL